MGEPTDFPGSNFEWKGWPTDQDRPEVKDLRCWRKDKLTVACWKLNWAERLAVLLTGHVWLSVLGLFVPARIDGCKPDLD